MFKKGVSPLIATVLLVMIVVSIGAAVMVVIQGLAQEGIESTENQQNIIKCVNDVELNPVRVGNNYRMCINESVFAITLENKGLMDISDFKLVVFASDIKTIDGGTSGLTRGSYIVLKYNISNSTGIDKIKLYPKIPGGPRSQILACDEPNLEWKEDQIKYMTNCSDVTWDDNAPLIS